jgi:type VI secretion system secreted protein Hcp
MAVDMFLKLSDVKGESVDSKHKDEIDILSWSWGMTQSGSMHQGGGGGSGKVSVHDLSVTKYVDKSSALLQLLCCNGKHLPEALLTVRKAGETALEYLKVSMKEVIISSISTGGTGADDRLTENVSLNFAEFKTSYTPQKSDGTGDAAVEHGWKIAKGEKV